MSHLTRFDELCSHHPKRVNERFEIVPHPACACPVCRREILEAAVVEMQERAAKVAGDHGNDSDMHSCDNQCADDIADAIRALPLTTDGDGSGK